MKLVSIYQSKGLAKKATLFKQLTLQRTDEGSDVREHVNQVFDAVDKLCETEVEVNPDLLTFMLLYCLPHTSGDELPSPDVFRVKLLEESDTRKSDVQNTMTVNKISRNGDQ